MDKLLIEYKRLKAQLTANVGCEESMDEVCWNDGIIEAMEKILCGVPIDIAQQIRLGHL
jgi:hypothetical protein